MGINKIGDYSKCDRGCCCMYKLGCYCVVVRGNIMVRCDCCGSMKFPAKCSFLRGESVEEVTCEKDKNECIITIHTF